MDTPDANAIRVAFIESHLNRALELASAGKIGPVQSRHAATGKARHILDEFQRYCQWYGDRFSDVERAAIGRMVRQIERTISPGN